MAYRRSQLDESTPDVVEGGPDWTFAVSRAKGHELGQALCESPATSSISLALAVIGSLVGAVLTSFAGGGHVGALIGAAIGPVVPLIFRPGPRGVRVLLIATLSLAALVVTVSGVTAADWIKGASVLGNQGGSLLAVGGSTSGDSETSGSTGASGGSGTSSGQTGQTDQTDQTGQTQTGSGGSEPGIGAPRSLDCGTAPTGGQTACDDLSVASTGGAALRITRLELTDGDFIATGCTGSHPAGSSCSIEVRFRPQADGDRTATLLIHQNLAGPATAVTLTGIGAPADTCATGYVWREAFDGDDVCVTPDVRTQAQQDNAATASRIDPTGAFGPNTCISGYVWRVARASDTVCVTPDVRAGTAAQNATPTAHRLFNG